MSASSYSRVVNRNRLRTHSSVTSTAADAVTTTQRGQCRPMLADARPVPAVTAGMAVSPSLLMLTWRSLPYRGMLLSRFLFQAMTGRARCDRPVL